MPIHVEQYNSLILNLVSTRAGEDLLINQGAPTEEEFNYLLPSTNLDQQLAYNKVNNIEVEYTAAASQQEISRLETTKAGEK